jgi:CRISPR/Cas system CSM-associated protein Csm2 small subunit
MEKVQIDYWPGATPLAVQLAGQNISIYDTVGLEKLQQALTAANFLYENNYLTENQLRDIFDIVHERIINSLSEVTKL